MIARTGLLTHVRDALDTGAVVLDGPDGIGKTTVLDDVARAAAGRVLRVTGSRAEQWMAGQALADLLASAHAPDMPEIRALTRQARRGNRRQTVRRVRFDALLDRWADDGPVLVVVDDAHRIDTVSADVLAHAARRADARTRFLFVGRSCAAVPARAARITVPPMTPQEIADLLRPFDVPERAAASVHADAAGNPAVALALAGGSPGELTAHARDLIARAVSGLPDQAHDTVLVCALAARPTITLLLRAGCADATTDLDAAIRCGLVIVEDDTIRFVPPAAAAEVARLAGAEARARVHHLLTTAVTTTTEVERHRALASPEPDGELATDLLRAARMSRREPAMAAELYLLAADRFPPDQAEQRLDALVAAIEVGVGAGVPALVDHVARAVLAEAGHPLHRVRVRTALVRHASQSAPRMAEVLAAAESDAAGDTAARAAVHLWRAYAATISGDVRAADADAATAVRDARSVGDPLTEALARTVRARAARMLGRPDWRAHLDAALAVPVGDTTGVLHLTPAYLAARFAAYDDSLDDAKATLLRLLGEAERGPVEDLMGPLCGLSEVTVRKGQCVEASDYAWRAARTSARAGLSPGPGWYATSVAELAGGDLARGRLYAEHGVRACDQEGDVLFRLRHLHALGHALTRQGETTAAISALREVQRQEAVLGHVDPTVLRWQPDLVLCLVRTGEEAEAERLIHDTRDRLDGPGRGVGAALDRALASVRTATGDPEAAIDLARDAAAVFAELGQPIERGRCLIVEATAHRRRRHYNAAMAAAEAAADLFTEIGALPWAEHARTAAAKYGLVGATTTTLTTTEDRVVRLVVEGATNREIAHLLYVTPKAVEATLTRVYRKLGLRSRAQLVRHLANR